MSNEQSRHDGEVKNLFDMDTDSLSKVLEKLRIEEEPNIKKRNELIHEFMRKPNLNIPPFTSMDELVRLTNQATREYIRKLDRDIPVSIRFVRDEARKRGHEI